MGSHGGNICQNFVRNFPVLFFNSIWEVYAIFELMVVLVIIAYVRHLQKISADELYMQQQSKIIFPIHRTLLTLIGVASLSQALVVVTFAREFDAGDDRYFGISYVTIEEIFGVLFALSVGMHAISNEGTTLMFISSGVGQRSIKRSFQIACIWGLCTAVVFYYNFLANFSNNPIYQKDEYQHFVDIISGLWQGCLLAFYLSLYLSSSWFNFYEYRPALTLWAKFWIITRGLLFASETLMRFDIDAGFCLFASSFIVFFILLKLWVAFRCYRLEAQWWHGELGLKPQRRSLVQEMTQSLSFLHRSRSTSAATTTPQYELNALESASPLAGLQLNGNLYQIQILLFIYYMYHYQRLNNY
jgi:hypothetical protein